MWSTCSSVGAWKCRRPCLPHCLDTCDCQMLVTAFHFPMRAISRLECCPRARARLCSRTPEDGLPLSARLDFRGRPHLFQGKVEVHWFSFFCPRCRCSSLLVAYNILNQKATGQPFTCWSFLTSGLRKEISLLWAPVCCKAHLSCGVFSSELALNLLTWVLKEQVPLNPGWVSAGFSVK